MHTYFVNLADRLGLNDPDAVESCIKFIESNTKGVGHGRARALMCRRLKHCTLTPQQRVRLVRYVIDRLHTGDFAQQFKDQLRLALFLDSPSLFEAAQKSLTDEREYVRRYANWILAHGPKHPNV
ncbi:hypothetical protein H6F96_29680 [Microcoleus sp. FACHB-53]|nr:hypothetical protein [Microcoleus sp. FACHB-53]